MENTFFVDIEKLSPTQFYLSKDKIAQAQKYFETHSLEDYDPLTVTKFCDKILLLSGHHFAYYLSTHGKLIVKVTESKQSKDFYLNIKLLSECEKKKVNKISDLNKRILEKRQYTEKWIKPFEDMKIKIDESPKTVIKTELITDRATKHEITYKILSPAPSYFANEFTFKHYIEMVSDTDYRVFRYCGHEIAFIATRPIYENILEIYMMGMCEDAQTKSLSDKIMAEVTKHAKAIGREFITVKVPAKSAVHNKTSKLYDFYLNYGFTHIESLESPWDEKRLCMLLVKH